MRNTRDELCHFAYLKRVWLFHKRPCLYALRPILVLYWYAYDYTTYYRSYTFLTTAPTKTGKKGRK